ncbi:MAG: cbb3-type cytochrome c oxidase subunit II [Verrucomicrobiota bacterium]|nr:cbb3-type cytochrome c oxidase subunit II [Verrucomicrobiota bacterium]
MAKPGNGHESSQPERIPAHPPTPQGIAHKEPRRRLVMTPFMATIGGLLAFFTVVSLVVVLPTGTYKPTASQNWLPLSNEAIDGRATYLANGCFYCHSGFVRPQDVYAGQYYLYPRVAEAGDYYGVDQSPNVFGSERTGPDLSQEGGMHPDDWQVAHYANPRGTQPLSIMPQFSFFDAATLKAMIAFNQESGGKEATLRYAAQTVGDMLMQINMGNLDPAQAFPQLVDELTKSGEYKPAGAPMDKSSWGAPWMAVWMLNSFERGYWLTNDPLPLTQPNLVKGKDIFLKRCSGCHGAQGNGKGPAAQFLSPQPFDFTQAGMMGPNGFFGSDGMFYHRILTAGPGTAMENFGTRLSVQDIWRVVLFLRTIQNGSLASQDVVPTVDMWQAWSAPPELLNYIKDHPIDQGPGVINSAQSDPFAAAAQWLAPGLAANDTVLVGGKLPMTPARLTNLIRTTYFAMVQQAYDDAIGRGESGLPPRAQIFSVEGVVFHEPS